MTWRKIHLDNEVWEWRVGKGATFCGAYIVIRSPTRTVTSVPNRHFGFAPVTCPTCGAKTDDVAITPGKVKAYIERNKASLSPDRVDYARARPKGKGTK